MSSSYPGPFVAIGSLLGYPQLRHLQRQQGQSGIMNRLDMLDLAAVGLVKERQNGRDAQKDRGRQEKIRQDRTPGLGRLAIDQERAERKLPISTSLTCRPLCTRYWLNLSITRTASLRQDDFPITIIRAQPIAGQPFLPQCHKAGRMKKAGFTRAAIEGCYRKCNFGGWYGRTRLDNPRAII